MFNYSLDMAEFMLIQDEEVIPRRIFRDRQNPLEFMNDAQLLSEYRFDRQSILQITAILEPDLEHQTKRNHALPAVFCLWDFPVGCGRRVQSAQVNCVQSVTPCG